SKLRFRWSADHLVLIFLSSVISLSALLFYYHHGTILLYGDAVAHINIARRVFDSRTPGLFQLGTVWLPLPHLLDIPFIVNDRLWRTGLGASVPSMLAYVIGTLGVFRLVRGLASRWAAWIAALIFAVNPNLIYMQATAMTEALYLALFVWTVVFFSEFVRSAGRDPGQGAKSLRNCALILSAAMLVRYDAWLLAGIVSASAFIVILRVSPLWGSADSMLPTQGLRPGLTHSAPPPPRRASASGTPAPALDQRIAPKMDLPAARRLLQGVIELTALSSLTAGLWLAYNHAHLGSALEVANGPYSAHPIH